MEEQVEEIVKQFKVEGKLEMIKPISLGNINTTFVVRCRKEEKEENFLLQEINKDVFQKPKEVMENIEKVTRYLKEKLEENNDKKHTTLEFIKTKQNELVYHTKENRYFRLCYFIKDSVSYNHTQDLAIIKEAGKAFGNFQRLLAEFPIETLHETIAGFHDTPKRYQTFLQDIAKDRVGRVKEVKREIAEIKEKAGKMHVIVNLLKEEKIPYRVTHNDTKLNNVLMRKTEKTYKAVIDLDTIMPSSALFDYGDGIRSTAASVFEDEVDTSKVYLELPLFEAYTEGYLSEIAGKLTRAEVNHLSDSILLLTLEQGMRFLQDYINGDCYFKTDYESHNLVRARNQLALLKDMEQKKEKMDQYIQKQYNRCKKKK